MLLQDVSEALVAASGSFGMTWVRLVERASWQHLTGQHFAYNSDRKKREPVDGHTLASPQPCGRSSHITWKGASAQPLHRDSKSRWKRSFDAGSRMPTNRLRLLPAATVFSSLAGRSAMRQPSPFSPSNEVMFRVNRRRESLDAHVLSARGLGRPGLACSSKRGPTCLEQPRELFWLPRQQTSGGCVKLRVGCTWYACRIPLTSATTMGRGN